MDLPEPGAPAMAVRQRLSDRREATSSANSSTDRTSFGDGDVDTMPTYTPDPMLGPTSLLWGGSEGGEVGPVGDQPGDTGDHGDNDRHPYRCDESRGDHYR